MKLVLSLCLLLFVSTSHAVIPFRRDTARHPVLIQAADDIVQFLDAALDLSRFFFRRGIEPFGLRFAVLHRFSVKGLRILSGKGGHIPDALQYNLVEHSLPDIVGGAVCLPALVTAAHEVVLFPAHGIGTVEIELGAALAAVEISCVFVYLPLLVRPFATLEMPLYHFEHLSAHYGFVGILKNQHILRTVFQPPFQLVGFGIGLEVDRVADVGLVFQHLAYRPL